MKKTRLIQQRYYGKPVLEGAGVHLNRVFGFTEVPTFDPFLLLDDFRSAIPEHYRKGFPWHPHRGIETITYMIDGRVEHGDSLGNQGVISSGDVQWMTAGSGIIHQEMPKGDADGKMGGFQLWANLPAADKMMKPRYRDIRSDQIPEVIFDNGAAIKVIAGEAHGITGPVTDIVIDPQFLDIRVPAGQRFSLSTNPEHTVFAYIIDGRGSFEPHPPESAETREPGNGTLVLFEPGEEICARTAEIPMRFLLISGMPLHEPIAWQGPIVMNSREELTLAFEEYQNGNFIK
jgi:redox-sensitive bicupin YhaK (pirin superfamily)